MVALLPPTPLHVACESPACTPETRYVAWPSTPAGRVVLLVREGTSPRLAGELVGQSGRRSRLYRREAGDATDVHRRTRDALRRPPFPRRPDTGRLGLAVPLLAARCGL